MPAKTRQKLCKIAERIGLIYPEIASAQFINNLILRFCFRIVDRVSDYNSSGLRKSETAMVWGKTRSAECEIVRLQNIS